jgi:hypothetical protein
MSKLHCTVYDTKKIIDTPNKKVADILKILKIELPDKLNFFTSN